MRKWLIILAVGCSFFGISRMFAADWQSIIRVNLYPASVYVDGKAVNTGGQKGFFHNGSTYVPATMVYKGSIYVPVELISQHLDKPIAWEDSNHTLWIGEKTVVTATKESQAQPLATAQTASAMPPAAPAGKPQPSSPSQAATQTSVSQTPQLFGIGLGATAEQVTTALGTPDRKEPGAFGYEWWIYNKSLDRYVQVGLRNNKVVDIYSNAPQASLGHVSIGTSYESLSRKHELKRIVSFHYQEADIQITNQPKERPLVMSGHTPIIFYLDKQNNNKVTAIRLIDKLALLQGGFYETRWSYRGTAPNFDPPPLTIKQQELVDAAHERQMLDLVNVIRYRYKLPTLTWHHKASLVAKQHSNDMENHDFFDHVSATSGLDPFERLKKAGLQFQLAGENIAAGFPDAIETHEHLMNSPGHRKNILEKGFAQLGVGVTTDFYTQNFITLR